MIRFSFLIPFLLVSLASFKPGAPHLHSTWGSQIGGQLDSNTARTILDSPLLVRDEQGASYTITRFRFNYKQLAQYKDDSTGKIMTDFRLFSREFYDTPLLDSLWRENIRPALQSGETIIIDNVVVKDAKGVKSLAPGLEFSIQ